jgi:serine protease Do
MSSFRLFSDRQEMSRRFTLVTVVLTASVAFLVGLIVAGELTPGPVVSTAPRVTVASTLARRDRPVSPGAAVNFADIAERINAAVVNIDATSKNARELRFRRGAEDPDTFPREFEGPRQGSGSGFVIDRGGYVLTNFHVIDGAERITVTLADGRSYRGEVVGTDPAIDVALLRIPGAPDLPEAPLGNSDELRVGEWVCAIGNPLGYVHSVTVGVVSFIGRKLFDASLDDYIQTDAAINFGNSGGPLINSSGHVIGINSAISSRASNIGFAVPINQAVAILPQLKTRGRVSRGFIGVELTDVTPALQRSLNLTVSSGALVQDVKAASPAERAGLKPYDIIVEVEGRQVLDNEELIRDISARQPGTVTRLEIVREGRRQMMTIKLAERPARDEDRADADPLGNRGRPRPQEPATDVPLGVSVRELDRSFVGRLEIPSALQGVVVSRVDPTGSAYQQLRRGFVILEINRHPIRSVADYQRVLTAAKPGDVLAIYYYDPTLAQRSLVTVTVE